MIKNTNLIYSFLSGAIASTLVITTTFFFFNPSYIKRIEYLQRERIMSKLQEDYQLLSEAQEIASKKYDDERIFSLKEVNDFLYELGIGDLEKITETGKILFTLDRISNPSGVVVISYGNEEIGKISPEALRSYISKNNK